MPSQGWRSLALQLANELAGKLEVHGVRCFVAPRAMEPGDLFEEKIFQAIRSCSEVCVLCTANSLRSEWVHTEYGAARIVKKTIVPVLYGVTEKRLPLRLRNLQTVPYNDKAIADYAMRLKRRIEP